MTEVRTTDAAFVKYADEGAYHWKEISRHWWRHNAFTAERYRRLIAALGGRRSGRVLDFGCGDGALLGLLHKQQPALELHGFDPNEHGLAAGRAMLERHGVRATLHADAGALPDDGFDAVVCTEVIEHVTDPAALLQTIRRVLAPGGTAVISTPIRLAEEPWDQNHRFEWFPSEFRRLLEASGLHVTRVEAVMPVAAVEAYFWRPRLFFRVPVFRVLTNLLSIYGGVNASTWLAMRPRLHMMQLAVLTKP